MTMTYYCEDDDIFTTSESLEDSEDVNDVFNGPDTSSSKDIDEDDLCNIYSRISLKDVIAKVVSDLSAICEDCDVEMMFEDPNNSDFLYDPIKIPLEKYIQRIIQLTKIEIDHPCAKTLVIMAYIYIMRIHTENQKDKLISKLNLHRMTFICLMIASKMSCDIPYNNLYYARISGTFSCAAVNNMEIECLNVLHWELNVTVEECKSVMSKLFPDLMTQSPQPKKINDNIPIPYSGKFIALHKGFGWSLSQFRTRMNNRFVVKQRKVQYKERGFGDKNRKS